MFTNSKIFFGSIILIALLIIGYPLFLFFQDDIIKEESAIEPVVSSYDINILRDFFSDIVIVTKYNYDPSIALLIVHDKIWSKVFINRIYIGPWNQTKMYDMSEAINSISKQNNSNYDNNNNNVTFINLKDSIQHGHVAYESLLKVMEIKPNYRGYLYKHDDFALNLKSFYYSIKVKKENIWTLCDNTSWEMHFVNFTTAGKKQIDWFAYKDPTFELKAMHGILANNYFKNRIISCNGDIYHWPAIAGSGDMIYIPKEEVINFNDKMKFFLKHLFFHEMALPLYLKCFTNTSLQLIPQCLLPKPYYMKGTNSDNIIKKCNSTAAIHPMKYVSRRGHKEAMNKYLIH